MKRIFLDIETLPPDEDARGAAAQEVLLAQMAKKKPATGGEIDQLVEDQFREMALHANAGAFSPSESSSKRTGARPATASWGATE